MAKTAIDVSRDRSKKWQHKLQEILLEIGIIVFAVSLSIWLHNWSEGRKDRVEEREFLEGLKADLQADMKEMSGDLNAYRIHLRATKYFEQVGAGRPLDKDSLNAFQWIYFSQAQINPRVSRFEALKSSGKIGIINNRQLLLAITDLYAKDFPRIARNNDYMNSMNQNIVLPFLASHLQLDKTGSGTNWQDILRLPQMRVYVQQGEGSLNNISAYSDGMEKCQLIIHDIDDELKSLPHLFPNFGATRHKTDGIGIALTIGNKHYGSNTDRQCQIRIYGRGGVKDRRLIR